MDLDRPERPLVGAAVSAVNELDVGHDDQPFGLQVGRQQRGRQVLVDHGRDAVERAVGSGRHRNPSSSSGYHGDAVVDQRRDSSCLDDLDGFGRRNYASPPAAVGLLDQRPAARLQAEHLRRRDHLADGLRRLRERRIRFVDERLGDQCRHDGRHVGGMEAVRQRLLQHVSHAPLGVRDADVEGQRRKMPVIVSELAAQEVVADLRAVPVRDHDAPLAARDQRRQQSGRLGGAREVGLDGVVALRMLKGVPAESDNDDRRGVGRARFHLSMLFALPPRYAASR